MSARVLIVDDDGSMLEPLVGMLEARLPGVLVDTCTSGASALPRIEKTDYDAIVSDIKMPTMDGWSAIDGTRAENPTDHPDFARDRA